MNPNQQSHMSDGESMQMLRDIVDNSPDESRLPTCYCGYPAKKRVGMSLSIEYYIANMPQCKTQDKTEGGFTGPAT